MFKEKEMRKIVEDKLQLVEHLLQEAIASDCKIAEQGYKAQKVILKEILHDFNNI